MQLAEYVISSLKALELKSKSSKVFSLFVFVKFSLAAVRWKLDNSRHPTCKGCVKLIAIRLRMVLKKRDLCKTILEILHFYLSIH